MELNGITLYLTLFPVSWLWGPLLRYSLWAHPGNVTGVKSCEPGAYYVSFNFSNLRTVVSQPVLGCAAPFDGGTTVAFTIDRSLPCASPVQTGTCAMVAH